MSLFRQSAITIIAANRRWHAESERVLATRLAGDEWVSDEEIVLRTLMARSLFLDRTDDGSYTLRRGIPDIVERVGELDSVQPSTPSSTSLRSGSGPTSLDSSSIPNAGYAWSENSWLPVAAEVWPQAAQRIRRQLVGAYSLSDVRG